MQGVTDDPNTVLYPLSTDSSVEFDNPPENLSLISGQWFGSYSLQSTRHLGFPVYKEDRNSTSNIGRYLYVRRLVKGDFHWVAGSKISDPWAELISYSAYPASSPKSWRDWTNSGTFDEPVLEATFPIGVSRHLFLSCESTKLSGLYQLLLSNTGPTYQNIEYPSGKITFQEKNPELWNLSDNENIFFANNELGKRNTEDFKLYNLSSNESAELENPPERISLTATHWTQDISGSYIRKKNLFHGFPIYRFVGSSERFLYVRNFQRGFYFWVVGTKVSDDAGELMTFSNVPPSSPASWGDWNDTGKSETPNLKQKRENGSQICLSNDEFNQQDINKYRQIVIEKLDSRICNKKEDCVGGIDEKICSLFVNPHFGLSFGITVGAICVGMVLYKVLVYFGLIEVDIAIQIIIRKTNFTELVDSFVLTIKQEDWARFDSMRNSYELLHHTKGGVRKFFHTIYTCIQKPKILHKVSTSVMKMENEIVEVKIQRKKIWKSTVPGKKLENKDYK